jgi:hypothetical protein
MKLINTKNNNKGAAMMIVVLFFMFISLTILIGIITPVVREFKIATDNFDSKKSYFIAESGAEDAIYRIKNNMELGTVDSERTLFIDGSYFSIPTEIVDLGNNRKKVITTGDIDTNKRKVSLEVTSSTGISFNYGVLIGQGGITLNGSGKVIGNVYANGPITGDSSGYITGSAISANSPDIQVDQSNGTVFPAPYSQNFGSSSFLEDFMLSFKPSNTGLPLNKIQLYIKKTGNPPNATLELKTTNVSGVTNTTGTLLSSSVTSSYQWVDLNFTTSPLLSPGATYWLSFDLPTNSSTDYYTIATNQGNQYPDGSARVGKMGGGSTPNTLVPSGTDVYFKTIVGGYLGSITGSSGSIWNPLKVGTVSGIAKAHTVNYTKASGNIYCKIGTGNNLTPNSNCIDTEPDPFYASTPVSNTDIQDWKTSAAAGGVYNGNYNVGSLVTLGPKKIVGNLSVYGGGVLNLTGPLWVTGQIIISGGGSIRLDPSYGSNDGVVITDNTISINSGGYARGSGVNGSYLMLVSLDNMSNNYAISISGGSGSLIVYAPYGLISLTGGSSLKAATGYKMLIDGNSTVTYESGLRNNNFSSGPSGSWSIDGWKEVE